MVTIAKDNDVVTVIVHFLVEPSQQQELVDNIVDYIETHVKQEPGFISANLHKSLDGNRVVNYAQWRKLEDFEAFMKKAQEQGIEPGIFQTISPDGHVYTLQHQAISSS